MERERGARREQLVALEHLLEQSREEQLALQEQLGSAKAQAGEFESRSEENARLVGELKNELKTVRASQTDSETIVAAQQERIRELSEKLAAQTAMFQRERELLAAGKEIRDLMGARNLHIIDVFDVDESGKSKRAFGRAFYTEGKSLIFYAFDLAPNKPSRVEHAFQAWGYREPARHPVQSLGIFYADDRTQNRWVLKFEDPEVLAQIDAVFVTVEPRGGSSKPTGQKLLYAYLASPITPDPLSCPGNYRELQNLVTIQLASRHGFSHAERQRQVTPHSARRGRATPMGCGGYSSLCAATWHDD